MSRPRPSDVTPDPAAIDVTYDVDYVRTDGSTRGPRTLQLVQTARRT